MPQVITSPGNPLVKRLLRLRERRARERERVVLVEGAPELARAVGAGWRLELLASCDARFSPDARAVAPRLIDAAREHRRLAAEAFDRASLRQGPDGLLGLLAVRSFGLGDLSWPRDAIYLVVSGLEKPGNFGALLRTAVATGVEAAFVTGAGADPWNPNVIRSSMGSVFVLPVLALSDEVVREALRREGVRIVATSPGARQRYWDAPLDGAVAVVVGSEHEGLGDAWRSAADLEVAIPMAGAVDSLNAATAGALVLYEVLRQRATGPSDLRSSAARWPDARRP